jgi:hypothetical protein
MSVRVMAIAFLDPTPSSHACGQSGRDQARIGPLIAFRRSHSMLSRHRSNTGAVQRCVLRGAPAYFGVPRPPSEKAPCAPRLRGNPHCRLDSAEAYLGGPAGFIEQGVVGRGWRLRSQRVRACRRRTVSCCTDAAAERDRVACLEPVAFGVEESDVAVNEVGAVVGQCDCDVVHCPSCLCCAPARRMRAGALDGGLVSGREGAREGRG